MTPVQLELPTAAEAERTRDEGIALAEAGAPEGWTDEALEFLRAYALTHDEVFVDDLWGAGLTRPPNTKAVGSVIRRAAREGVLEHTGTYRPSAVSHRSPRPVWRSRIFTGGPCHD